MFPIFISVLCVAFCKTGSCISGK